jgi:hypothetical protein
MAMKIEIEIMVFVVPRKSGRLTGGIRYAGDVRKTNTARHCVSEFICRSTKNLRTGVIAWVIELCITLKAESVLLSKITSTKSSLRCVESVTTTSMVMDTNVRFVVSQ